MSSVSDLVMPKLGLTMTEGTVSEWTVSAGASFSRGDVVLIVETDKIANEIEAPADGTLREIIVSAGETVPVGSVLARWDVGDVASSGTGKTRPEPLPPTSDNEPQEVGVAKPAPVLAADGRRVVATPLAKRIAKHEGIDLRTVQGTGPNGRIKANDVRRAKADAPVPGSADPIGGTRIDATPYQAAAARRLAASKQETPHFYLATEVDADPILDIRQRLSEVKGLPRLTISHLIVAAVGRALVQRPEANRVWDKGAIVQFENPDVGIAVNTKDGLFVPILRDAGRIGLGAIAAGASDLIERARNGRLEPDDTRGGAITVSNAGMFDVTYLTPMINPGQSSILGVGSVREVFRPDGSAQPVLHREIGLVLSCDHRVHDGVGGLALLNEIKDYLKFPMKLLVT